MNKLIALILVLFITLTVVGCSDENANSSGESEEYVLATTTSDASNGYKLIQGAYVNNNSYRDEWLINPLKTSITLEPQQTDVWCWAACARMMSFRYMDPQISQASVAVKVKNGDETLSPTQSQIDSATKTAGVEQVVAAVKYLLSSENCYGGRSYIYAESALRYLLDHSNPVIMLRGNYVNGIRSGSHASIIYDYRWDSNLQDYLYDVYDPLPVDIGRSYSTAYEGLCRERVQDETYYVWESVVTFMEDGCLDVTAAPKP